MKSSSRNQMREWSQDFQEFLSVEEKNPPMILTQQIYQSIHRDLNPSKYRVFSKLALIHGFVGTFTLFFCPYSELYSIESFNIMHVLMNFGEQVCMLGCGALFLGTSSFVASLLLRPEEVQVIRKARILQISIVALLSMALFMSTGLLLLENLALFWALGSILGGLLTLEFGWALRLGAKNRN
jgi:hypothetical protein